MMRPAARASYRRGYVRYSIVQLSGPANSVVIFRINIEVTAKDSACTPENSAMFKGMELASVQAVRRVMGMVIGNVPELRAPAFDVGVSVESVAQDAPGLAQTDRLDG